MSDWLTIGLALVVTATAVLVVNRVIAARKSDDQ
jgi:hypothetical protein